MNQDTAHAWWSRLRHQGLLLSPVVMLDRYPGQPPDVPFYVTRKLKDAYTRFAATLDPTRNDREIDQNAALAFADVLLEEFTGHKDGRIARQNHIPEKLTAATRIGSRSETLRPHRVIFADAASTIPALLVVADTSPRVGRGRGRTVYARFLELLRGTGHRLGLLTNGLQVRLVYAGLDFESWCEWETERWFDDGEGTEELRGLRQLLAPDSLTPSESGLPGLLDAVEESRKKQADLSSVLRENVRQAIELLLEEVSAANRTNNELFHFLVEPGAGRRLSDAEAQEALLQASVRLVMRMVVCLFAESRGLLPVNDPVYARSYGVRSLYELLDEAVRDEGGDYGLRNRQMAWPRLMALFRLIYGGSAHGSFTMRAYGGALFRPGTSDHDDAVLRALHILEHGVAVRDVTVYHVLRKLLRGPLPVLRGRTKTFVEGPVDYTDLRTEFIGLIYEGLLDYRLKRTDEQIGPQIFLNIGREPVLPLYRLEDMLENDKKGLKDLLTTLRKEKVTATAGADEEEPEEKEEESTEAAEGEEESAEVVVEESGGTEKVERTPDYLDADARSRKWAREAALLAGPAPKKRKKEPEAEYQARVDAEANRLIKRVVPHGEFYLVRAGNTRKGTGTFYTRPQLAVPTVHRTLQPLCYDKAEDGTLTPKKPEVILGLKVCDSSCGSASFLVAALHYLTDALYESLKVHCDIEDPKAAKRITLPYGRTRTGKAEDEILPFPPDDPQRGDQFAERIKALLRRHVVERCIYGVDINPLAVEFARVSLWIETLDNELPFTFLDHKIKVGNSLVGCWLDRVLDYPIKAWEREGGDGKDGERTARIEMLLKGEENGGRRSGDGQIKKEMRQVIESRFTNQPQLFEDTRTSALDVVAKARATYEHLHEMPLVDADAREAAYRRLEADPTVHRLKQAMDEWCAVWFWPMDTESARHVPTPLSFHAESDARTAIRERLGREIRFFHWELEFPDVFTSRDSGFDAIIGNPPWENLQPNPQEFFTEFDPLFRTYGRMESLRNMRDIFASVPDSEGKWLSYCGFFKSSSAWVTGSHDPFGDEGVGLLGRQYSGLQSSWKGHRESLTFTSVAKPFLHQIGRVFTYKLFLESNWFLLRSDGRIGVIVPTNLYSDLWSLPLRREFMNNGRIEFIYAFQNEKRVFEDAHHAQKQMIFIAAKGGTTTKFNSMFRLGTGDSPRAWEIPNDVLTNASGWLEWTPQDLLLFSPKAQALSEIRTARDLAVCRRIYHHAVRLGDTDGPFRVSYGIEFMMNVDAKAFPPREQWEERGYRPDAFGRWVNAKGEKALPLYEGRMLGLFDCSQKGWESGKGRSAIWRSIPFDRKEIVPQYLMSEDLYASWERLYPRPKYAHMRIAAGTNTRTLIGAVVPGLGCGDTSATLTNPSWSTEAYLVLAALMSSLTCDYAARLRVGGLHIDWFLVSELPLPSIDVADMREGLVRDRLIELTARLTLVHRCFAPDWLRMKSLLPYLNRGEWKCWWAVSEADRLRLRVEIDALCAGLYGLEPDDFDWIVRDDPTDPKGFYRVDRNLPFRERLTGLAAAAFRALKEGKWSTESAAKLSNDEFFEVLGIPELTSEKAAKAMGLDAPLIRKRDGCHAWHPERFTSDDPRYGWTWDHCRQDALALLGSEEAVEAYINPKPPEPHDGKEQAQESKGKKLKCGVKGKPKDRLQLPSEETQQRLSSGW